MVRVTVGDRSDLSVAQCLEQGQVWLYIETDHDQVLRSECVGTPATGLEALRTAEVGVNQTSSGLLCTLAGYPSRCPTQFDGQYWNYWHAGSAESAWAYSRLGAGNYRPEPGSIEGWCYNTASEKTCEPTSPSGWSAPAPRVDLAPSGTSTPWAVVAVILVVMIAAVVAVRRRSTGS